MSGGSGALVGAVAGSGALLVIMRVAAFRRPTLEQRVVPYLGRVGVGARSDGVGREAHNWRGLVSPVIDAAAARLGRVLGGAGALRRRLERAGSSQTVDQFRLEQLAWAAAGFGLAFAFVLALLATGRSLAVPAALTMCAAAGLGGALAREQLLGRQERARIERIASEFPPVVDLIALAVAAGEGVAGAFARVSRVSAGDLATELRRALDDTRAGASFADALHRMTRRVDSPAVTRFVNGVVVAVERGTPLADVLRAQAADAREARRRELMESAGRREIAMLVPVVFLILPVTVVFALFPGFYGLSLSIA